MEEMERMARDAKLSAGLEKMRETAEKECKAIGIKLARLDYRIKKTDAGDIAFLMVACLFYSGYKGLKRERKCWRARLAFCKRIVRGAGRLDSLLAQKKYEQYNRQVRAMRERIKKDQERLKDLGKPLTLKESLVEMMNNETAAECAIYSMAGMRR